MKEQREHWGSKVGFLMATAGSAIGLGSLWRFPYIIGQNGGGAFVILYLLFTLLIGIPVFIAELVIGRSAQKGAVLSYESLSKPSSNWKMAGWLNIVTNFLILSYYSVVAGWAVNYTFMSLSQFTLGKTPEQISQVFETLFASSEMSLFWHFIFMLMTVGVVFGGVKKGIEHWSKILTPALLVILLALFSFAITLPGFSKAVHFTLYPSFERLSSGAVLDALGMSFWTLSIGLGILVTYGSYMKPSTDIPKTGFVVAITSTLVSLFAALMIFPIVFSFGLKASSGPGLVFQTLPILFSQLPASVLLSTVFFILFVFAALTSSISILEVIVSNLMELFHWKRKKAVFLSGLGAFFFGIPSALSGSGAIFPQWKSIYGKNFFDTLNYITGSWMMPISGLLVAIFVGWFMDKKIAKEEYLKGTTLRKGLRLWFFLIRWVAPVGVLIIILQEAKVIDINGWFS